MEEVNRKSGHGLGVASLILAIVSIVIAIIPCVGFIAFFTGITAIILGAIGMSQASRDNSPKGMMLGGVIVGAFAIMITFVWFAVIAGISRNADHLGGRFESFINDLSKDIKDEFDTKDFKITIEEGDNKVEIQGSANRDQQIDQLEELEGVEVETDSVKQDTSGGQ